MAGATSPALVERDRELALVRELVEDTAAARARIAVVEGPAGIGKSGLLAVLRAEADGHGFRVLAARGTELERAFPYGVVRQLFEQLVVGGQPEDRLAGAAEASAPVFRAPAEHDATEDASFGVLHGLYWLTLNLAADRPLALVVDDLHSVDVPSLRFLAYLAHRLEGQPVLVAVGLRSAEPGTDAALLADIASDTLATHVRPGPLSVAAVAELARERLGDTPAPAFADACHDATGGNPLLLHELLKTLASEGVRPSAEQAGSVRELGSRAISRTVLMRLARLSPDAAAVARAVAVLGEGVEVAAVAALAELDERRLVAASRDLTRAEILRPDLPLGFVHPLVRDAVYDDLAAGERELMHARAVDVLRRLDAPVQRVAAHWLILPRRGDPEVATALREAARLAFGRGAPDSAAAYLRRALEEPVAGDVRTAALLELALAEAELQLDEAPDRLREVHGALVEPVQRARVAEMLARQLAVAARGDEAAEVVRTAIAELPAAAADERQRLEAMELFSIAFGASATDFPARLEQLRCDVGEVESAWALEAQLTLHEALRGRPAAECVPRARATLEEGAIGETDPAGAFASIIVLVLAEDRAALDLLEGLRGVAHRRGSLFAMVGLQVWHSWSLLAFGEIDEAAASLRDAAETQSGWAPTSLAAVDHTSATAARTLLEQGDVAGARRALERRGNSTPGSDAWLFGRLAAAELLLAEDRHADVLGAVEDIRRYDWRADNPAWLPWRVVAARALSRLGRDDDAVSLIDEDLVRARLWGTPGPIGRALRVRAELAGGEEERLREAVEVLSTSAWRLERAKALASLGRSIRLSRRPADARPPLVEAFEIASSCGAAALARDVRTELYATGARPRRAAATGAGSLTPSELRVATLARDGKTNREIAQALFVTPKTVELHLSNAYRKLGIRSRGGLAQVLT
ncbi:MAG TPA: AAA family ATPase [Gaiellaceae bacterium]